jgi:hypothetical protein
MTDTAVYSPCEQVQELLSEIVVGKKKLITIAPNSCKSEVGFSGYPKDKDFWITFRVKEMSDRLNCPRYLSAETCIFGVLPVNNLY